MPAEAYPISTNVRPEPAAIEIGRCAFLVMNMQNSVGARGSRFDRAGIDISTIQRATDDVAERMHPRVP